MLAFGLLSILVTLSEVTSDQQCPPSQKITPFCQCFNYRLSRNFIRCESLNTPEDLVSTIGAIKGFHRLNIEYSDLGFIPEDVFEGASYKEINFIHTKIMALSDTDIAFKGLEGQLEVLKFEDSCCQTSAWDWSQLRNLRRLWYISISKLISLDYEFPSLPSLRTLEITSGRLDFINPNAFASLENLDIIRLDNCEISTMSRSMLPKPATKLTSIHLRNNKLTSLPKDFFTDMPLLKYVVLNGNQLVTIEEETFSAILNQVVYFDMENNKINCDCRLKWLSKRSRPTSLRGSCYGPENVRGELLNSYAQCE